MVDKYETIAKNAMELLSNLQPLDSRFLISLESKSLNDLAVNVMNISKSIETLYDDFNARNLPKNAIKLLEAKKICFNSISSILNLDQFDREKLQNCRSTFEEWGYYKLSVAAGAIDNFYLMFQDLIRDYKHINEIPFHKMEGLLKLLPPLSFLDGTATVVVAEKIQVDPKEFFETFSQQFNDLKTEFKEDIISIITDELSKTKSDILKPIKQVSKELAKFELMLDKQSIEHQLILFTESPKTLRRNFESYVKKVHKSSWSEQKKTLWSDIMIEILGNWQQFEKKKWRAILDTLSKFIIGEFASELISEIIVHEMMPGVKKLITWIQNLYDKHKKGI